MRGHFLAKPLIYWAGVFFILSLTTLNFPQRSVRISCSLAFAKGQKGGPPSHAKAYGFRAKHNYRYYPSAKAYYDTERRMYFYLDGTNWRVSASLPSILKVNLGNYVTIEMDEDKPYSQFEEHQRNYR